MGSTKALRNIEVSYFNIATYIKVLVSNIDRIFSMADLLKGGTAAVTGAASGMLHLCIQAKYYFYH